MGRITIPPIKAMKDARTKKGPKGSSLFREYLLEIIKSATPKRAPPQKAIRRAERAMGNPKSQPRPRMSLASPRPIHLPRDMSQSKAKGAASIMPERISRTPGKWIKKLLSRKRNMPKNARPPKERDRMSGIILWRRS